MQVVPVRQLLDNYAYLVIDPSAGLAAVVDVAEAGPVLEEAERRKVKVVAILSTHHHYDHVGGNEELVGRRWPDRVEVFGYTDDRERLPCLTRPLSDGESFEIGGLTVRAIFVPAHTSGHLAYYFPSEATVFTGDTLFAGGCGRLFEGDAAQMMASLSRLASLPDHTLVYCGHEYTRGNLEFAATLEPGNPALTRRRSEVERLLEQGLPTVPTTIGTEKATNPFLRTNSPELRATLVERLGDLADGDVAAFAATRQLKDEF